ncbi:tetratricopeptide repeat protein [Pseudomonas sp. MMS21-TM103]|uniref:tetratricopeptide repeat protein n=1 Tax=Pseudomonas sp. MMS21 TM103 TaxID=2886506 RepID=UPI001EDF34A7|nr:tetratricopeptide repeat protein [Pseudomonas sp. MMS21 TM103]MCG4455833.1 tetratricopeptide repeat protein [Pseudomonas sp. MMS21 TM103]
MPHADTTDVRGLPLSGASAAAAERFETLIDDLYYYRLGVSDRLVALLQEFPEFVMGHVLMGYSLMSEGTQDAHPKAREYLLKAEALTANPRERLHQEALRAWLAQDLSARAAAWEQVLVDWPLDLLALRQHTGTLFWTGDKRHQVEVCVGVAGHWSPQTPGYGHFLSAHAFAMEEVGHYALAERYARAALALQPQDLWALHGLSHVLEMQGRIEEGIELLDEATGFLDNYNLFRGHLWWHLSLFRLSQGQFGEVLELFDRKVYPQSSTFYLDIQNGVSLLARLEVQGIDVGPARWERLAQASLHTATQSTVWFTALHHVMALMRSGRLSAVQATLDYLGKAGANSTQAALAHQLARAGVAFYQDKPGEALELMLAVRQRHGELGASHLQQDLYDQLMVMAALQRGDLPRVRQLLKARLSTRIWDAASWQAFEERARRVDEVDDQAAVRAALRWAVG